MDYKNILTIPECEKIGIYGILNTENGKMYIGSAKNIKRRLTTQRNNLISMYGCNTKIRHDISRKTDLKKFKFVILETFEDGEITDFQLAKIEKGWQKKYNTIENGYNFDIAETSGRSGKKEVLFSSPQEIISLTLPKGTKGRIKAAGKTCNGLINALVMEWLERQEQNAATLPKNLQQIPPEDWPL